MRRRSRAKIGLSPRVRGNPPVRRRLTLASRSIPACAGEPSPASIARVGCGVYPRVCGGTRAINANEMDNQGLSPRVRGNPRH